MSFDRRRRGPIAAVIPAHDEAHAIASVVRGAARHVELVIVIDDASRDGTATRARGAGAVVVTLPERSGKGSALRAGLTAAFARGCIAAVTLDGDGQHLTGEIPRLLRAYLDGAELVLGDRFAQRQRMPLVRRLTNVALTAALRPWIGPAVRDSQCGFRLIAAPLYTRLRLTACCFEIESEVLIEAARAGAVFAQVPVSAVYADEVSKIRPAIDGLRLARLLGGAALRSARRSFRRSLAATGSRHEAAAAPPSPG